MNANEKALRASSTLRAMKHGDCACPECKALDAAIEALARTEGGVREGEPDGLREASTALGAWMAAALDDPAVCVEMKRDIEAWMEALPVEWHDDPAPRTGTAGGGDDGKLWALHIEGPDDVHPAPSRELAQQAADLFNATFPQSDDPNWPRAVAKVIEWPHGAASHALEVPRFVDDWIKPTTIRASDADEDRAIALNKGSPREDRIAAIQRLRCIQLEHELEELRATRAPVSGGAVDTGCQLCGKNEGEHRFGYSASRCTFTRAAEQPGVGAVAWIPACELASGGAYMHAYRTLQPGLDCVPLYIEQTAQAKPESAEGEGA